MTARCSRVVEDLAGVFAINGAVQGALGAILVPDEMMVGATIVANLYIVGEAKATGVACGAAMAVRRMMGVATFAHMPVPAHHAVVAGR